MWRPFVFSLLIVWAAGEARADARPFEGGARTFTDVFGRSLEAEIVLLAADSITLRRLPDGAEFSLPLDRLSDADRDYLEGNRAGIVAWLTPLPETPFVAEARRDFRTLKRGGLALEAIPPHWWTKTRYFVIVYGLADTPEISGIVVKNIGEAITRDLAARQVGVLWIGPSNANGAKPPPVPESDLKMAKLLPAGVAVIGTEAVARDRAKVDAEIMAIARDESPADPALFFRTNYHSRHEAVRAVWRKRIMAGIASYWPGCAYRHDFDRRNVNGPIQAFVVDREGAPVLNAAGEPLEGFALDMIPAAAALTSAGK